MDNINIISSIKAEFAKHHCEKQCWSHHTTYTCILLDWPLTQFSSQTRPEKIVKIRRRTWPG